MVSRALSPLRYRALLGRLKSELFPVTNTLLLARPLYELKSAPTSTRPPLEMINWLPPDPMPRLNVEVLLQTEPTPETTATLLLPVAVMAPTLPMLSMTRPP